MLEEVYKWIQKYSSISCCSDGDASCGTGKRL